MLRPLEMSTHAASIACSPNKTFGSHHYLYHPNSPQRLPVVISSGHKETNHNHWGIGGSRAAVSEHQLDSIASQHIWMMVLLPRNKRRLKPIRPTLQSHSQPHRRSIRACLKQIRKDRLRNELDEDVTHPDCPQQDKSNNPDETETTSPTGDMSSSRSTLLKSPMETSRLDHFTLDANCLLPPPLPPFFSDSRLRSSTASIPRSSSSFVPPTGIPSEIRILIPQRTTSPTRVDVETSVVRLQAVDALDGKGLVDNSMDAYIGDTCCRSEASCSDFDHLLAQLDQLEPPSYSSRGGPAHHMSRHPLQPPQHHEELDLLPLWNKFGQQAAIQHDSVWGITTATLDDVIESTATPPRTGFHDRWEHIDNLDEPSYDEWPSDEEGNSQPLSTRHSVLS